MKSQLKHLMVLVFSIIQSNSMVFAQENTDSIKPSISLGINQKGKYHNFPGAYSQSPSFSSTILVPGQEFEINYHITGYGQIDHASAKMFYEISSPILDKWNSNIIYDLKVNTDENGRALGYSWGGRKDFVDRFGYLILRDSLIIQFIHPVTNKLRFQTKTYFDDYIKPDGYPKEGIINSEIDIVDINGFSHPPVKFKLKLKENVRPGNYHFFFTLTYFNGEGWKNDKYEQELKVLSWYEIHENKLRYLSYLIGFLAVRPIFIWFSKTQLMWKLKKIKAIKRIRASRLYKIFREPFKKHK